MTAAYHHTGVFFNKESYDRIRSLLVFSSEFYTLEEQSFQHHHLHTVHLFRITRLFFILSPSSNFSFPLSSSMVSSYSFGVLYLHPITTPQSSLTFFSNSIIVILSSPSISTSTVSFFFIIPSFLIQFSVLFSHVPFSQGLFPPPFCHPALWPSQHVKYLSPNSKRCLGSK